MFSIGNDELDNIQETISKGDKLIHVHEDGTEEICEVEETDELAYYKLKNEKMYLCGISGKKIGDARKVNDEQK